jgi:aspartyl-tRNA(Asn)/glutamyl-tRNA(Gln) amidotransferase subunit C
MAKLKHSDVVHVAKLANLRLSEAEITKFTKQLKDVIDYIEDLDNVETSLVEPTSQTTGLTNITRQDKINPNYILDVEAAISGKDDTHNNYFVVPMLLTKRKDR